MDTQLHMFLFPFMERGHMIPMVDIAKLLAARGVKVTIVMTLSSSISKSLSNIHLLTLVGMPEQSLSKVMCNL